VRPSDRWTDGDRNICANFPSPKIAERFPIEQSPSNRVVEAGATSLIAEPPRVFFFAEKNFMSLCFIAKKISLTFNPWRPRNMFPITEKGGMTQNSHFFYTKQPFQCIPHQAILFGGKAFCPIRDPASSLLRDFPPHGPLIPAVIGVTGCRGLFGQKAFCPQPRFPFSAPFPVPQTPHTDRRGRSWSWRRSRRTSPPPPFVPRPPPSPPS